MEVIIITPTVFQDTCTHGAHLPIEDTRMGCFGEKKEKVFLGYGTVRYTLMFFIFCIHGEKEISARKRS